MPLYRKDWFWETACLAIFIIISLAYTCGRIGLHSDNFLLSSSDAANIPSFSAALDHPELFTNDALLKDPANFAFYNTLHVPLICALAKWFGNYSTPFAFLIFPLTFLYLLGYYWLGREVIKNRFLALIFSLIVLIPVQLNLSEIWGLWRDMIPRFLFEALLPFGLAALMRWGKNPKWWPWLMASLGLLVYAHPVSLPAWGLAALLSLWFLSPDMLVRSKLSHLLLAGFVFLIVIMPFTYNYLSTTTSGSRGSLPYEELIEILRKRFISGFLDLNIAFKDFIRLVVISDGLMVFLWTFVCLGTLSFLLNKKKKSDSTLLIITTWWISIFLVSVVLPVLDHALANRQQRLSYEFDLVRNLRFSIPLLMLSFLYLLNQFQHEFEPRLHLENQKASSFISATLSILLLFGWIERNDFAQDPAFVQTARCWSSGQLVCPFPQEETILQQIGMLEGVRNLTSPGSHILAAAVTSELMMRYYSLRTLIYSYKDGGPFIYSNLNNLRIWWQQFLETSRVQALDSRESYLDGWVDFAQKYHADYLVLEEEYDPQKYYPVCLNVV